MNFKIASWNINSVRLRIDMVTDFLKTHQPDVLCLQEIKCLNDQFPLLAIREAGYEHVAINGQKGTHGVATISRLAFTGQLVRGFCNKGDARHIAVDFDIGGGQPLRLHNFYVPAGGDMPDPEKNDKFAHKLDFLDEMEKWFKAHSDKKTNKVILVGDLNIAPDEADVWSHKQLLRVVSHTPIEVEHLAGVQKSHSFVDVVRRHNPLPEKLYSWWSYRAKDWMAADRGRRLDHIWASPAAAGHSRGCTILRDARGFERPSDHAPVIAVFKF